MKSLSRRTFMKTATIGCAAMASPMITDAAKKGKGRPNVLFIIEASPGAFISIKEIISAARDDF